MTYMEPRLSTSSGRKINFFSISQLAPKYVKVVANSKKLVAIMTHTKKSTFHASINFQFPIKIGTSFNKDIRMGHIQR